MNDIEFDSLRADLQSLLAEINRVGPPDPAGVFAPDGDHERLVTRHWVTRRHLARHECFAHTHVLLDSVRTLLALDAILDSRGGMTRQRQAIELTGLKVDSSQFDEYDIRLRRSQLEREFKKALRQTGEEREL